MTAIALKSSLAAVFATAFAMMLVASPSHASLVSLSGHMDASQVVDINGNHTSNSLATGEVTVTMDTALQTITADMTWQGLSAPTEFSHIHDAPFGVSRLVSPNNRFFHELIFHNPPAEIIVGGLILCNNGAIDCAPTTGELHNTLDLSDGSYFDPTGVDAFTDFDALLAALLTGDLFVDIHTELFRGGEIRGQLLASSSVPEPASLVLVFLGLAGLGRNLRRKHKPAA